MITYFGIRHLSPSGAMHLRRLLDEKNPDIVLVEGPSDLNELMDDVCNPKSIPPIAIMAYSESIPIQSILYPFAEYSPEYQAILWAKQNKKECRFIDLPSQTFLSLAKIKAEKKQEELLRKKEQHMSDDIEGHTEDEIDLLDGNTDSLSGDRDSLDSDIDSPDDANIYDRIARLSGEIDHETYWERTFEHNLEPGSYLKGVTEYGKEIRNLSNDTKEEQAKNLLREAFMKRMIVDAVKEGYAEEKIVVVTGAFHVEGLKVCKPLTLADIKKLPRLPSKHTLMPYSYYRLSSMSGYGAGNNAPAYYELLWKGMIGQDMEKPMYEYLAGIAAYLREKGAFCSSAEVIEAVRLARVLASIKGGCMPVLSDLRDAAMTCLGHGDMAEISIAVAANEVGTKIGSLPEGISRTSVQEDFYRQLSNLRLDSYKTVVKNDLRLDLREKTTVKTESAAFMDLYRSFFLHRLSALGIHFAKKQAVMQENATWAESWELAWTPEAEIEIVEIALKGDTIEQAVAFSLKEQLDSITSITEAASILEQACMCGMPESISHATNVLQALAIDASAVDTIADTAYKLSGMLRFGTIRRLELKPLEPILSQLYLRSCLLLPTSCNCNNAAVGSIVDAIRSLNEISLNHDFLDEKIWLDVLSELSNRDDINSKASGFATAILLERGKITNELLHAEVSRRLSKGTPADLGAAWFEGLALKNRYVLISRLSLWSQLSDYIDALDEEEFKRALVFLRRAFMDFSPKERNSIAENLGEVWGFEPDEVSEVLQNAMTEEEISKLDDLDDFDFDDL
ncbi:MAG: hypothetical protein E7256_18020 [Lachnospiraceae bacterium]|nr:hypothetical protein [Lachnospiraceae bacterium]